jgi:hypothetical protein
VAPPLLTFQKLLMLEDSESLSCTEESAGSKDVECWDQDEYGDQAYNDQTFEMNEDLVPRNETGDGAEERWGHCGGAPLSSFHERTVTYDESPNQY